MRFIPLSIVGQVVKTLPFHGSNMGSIPIRCVVYPFWGKIDGEQQANRLASLIERLWFQHHKD